MTAGLAGLLAGAVALGLFHGVEPGHGWPVAASYALDQSNRWLYGLAASTILGVGHLVSSVAMVAVFFVAKSHFALTQVNQPITLAGGVQIGGPVGVVAGVVLLALGVREYRHGHSHSHGDVDGHDHGDGHSHTHVDGEHDHTHDHTHAHAHDAVGHSHDQSHDLDHTHSHASGDGGWLARLKRLLPFGGGHSHGSMREATDRGLWGIAGFAFLLGFAHEEEFEIIAMCAGSAYCVELMGAYALAVVVGIVSLTLLRSPATPASKSASSATPRTCRRSRRPCWC